MHHFCIARLHIIVYSLWKENQGRNRFSNNDTIVYRGFDRRNHVYGSCKSRTNMDAFIKIWGSFNQVSSCKQICNLTWSVILLKHNKALLFLLLIDVVCLCIQELGWYYKFVFFTGWCANLLNNNTRRLWIAVYIFCKNPKDTISQIFSTLWKGLNNRIDSKQG